MNKQKLSDRAYPYPAVLSLTAATITVLLTSITTALAQPIQPDQVAVGPNSQPLLARSFNAIPTPDPSGWQRVATGTISPEETVKRYLRFVQQGIWDHNQQAPRQAATNLWYAYNLLSPRFQSDVARGFDKFKETWLLNCGLQYDENQIYFVQQVGDVALVYAPIEMPRCRDRLQYLKLKFDSQGRWQIDAAVRP